MEDLKDTDGGRGHKELVANMSKEELVCEQCKIDNNIHPAMGWCETCDELLCDECYRTHCRPKTMRDHQLYSIPDMKIRKQKKRIANRCEKHEGELLKYYCEDHSELGCSQCFVTKHRMCIKVVSIVEVETSETEEFKSLEKLLIDQEIRLNAIEETRERNVALTTRQHDEAIADIKKSGEQLKSLIDTLVNEQLSKAEQNMETNLRNMADIEDTNRDIRDKIQSSKEMLNEGRGDNKQLFVTTKHLQREAASLDAKLRESEKKNKVSEYEFVLNPDLASVLVKVKELGTLADTQILNMEKATDEVIEEMEVRRFQGMSPKAGWSYGGKSDAIHVSTDHDIRLLYVLIFPCIKGDTEVTLNISEGGHCLINCYSSHKKTDKDVIDVKVANDEGPHGITLQAGHQYDVAVTIKGNLSPFGKAGLADVTVEGVKFFFSNSVLSYNNTEATRGQIAGFKFTCV